MPLVFAAAMGGNLSLIGAECIEPGPQVVSDNHPGGPGDSCMVIPVLQKRAPPTVMVLKKGSKN